MIFYLFLTFALFFGLYRSLADWLYLLFMKTPVHKEPASGVTVDVFTTAMPGEPYEMFEKTLAAIAAIRYPHESYLLDGGNDPALKALCERLGIHHLDCRGITGAKAGKINYALTQSQGEFILVIDPDHIPEPDFFDKVLGHFSDPEVGFVQVVQAYYNQDESFVAKAAAEQQYNFYGPTLMGMNGLGTAVVIGANCTFRRKALEDIDGHAVDLVEDLCTSMRLHSHKWKSVYVPQRLSFGINPADLHSYFKQQLKWSTGMFNLFFREYFGKFTKLNIGQKLHYLFAGTFYLEGLATAITCILPILFLFFELYAVEMQLDEFIVHLTPYAVMSLGISFYVQRWFRHTSEKGLLWRGMVLFKGAWPIFTLGFLYWATRTKVPYLPTPKKAEKGIFTNLVMPHIAVIALSAAAIIYALVTYERFVTGTKLMIFFALCNIVLMMPTVLIAHAGLFSGNKSEGTA
ncbi:MAG: glycosyltransferase [Chitinivibrionales bacterium]|nr:glycosyltransferase [Chitinivibrionales bacterium]